MGAPTDGFVPVANLEITAVRPQAEGFRLQGTGADGADYLVDLHLDMRIDRRTQTVLGELFAQSEWQVFRRTRAPLRDSVRRSPTRSETPK